MSLNAAGMTSVHCEPSRSRLPHCRCVEQVVYRYDGDRVPAITYRSLPHGSTGGADTLDEARKIYRSGMTRLLGVSRAELPHRVEHVEALVGGMWVRDRVGAVHRDALDDRMFLQRLLSAGPAQDTMRAYVRDIEHRGANPVIVLAEPGDTVGSVLDQMRASDVLVVVHPDRRKLLGWVAVYGANAVGAGVAVQMPDGPDVGTMSIASFTLSYAQGGLRAVRIAAQHLWPAESLAG